MPVRDRANATPLSPPTIGLLASVGQPFTDRLTEEDRWTQGFEFRPQKCGAPGGISTLCPNPVINKATSARPDSVFVDAYFPFVRPTCSTFGFAGREPATEAIQCLEASREVLVSTEFNLGATHQAQGLAGNWLTNDNTVPGPQGSPNYVALTTPVQSLGVVQALSALETALCNCSGGQTGMIHVPPGAISFLCTAMLIERDPSGILRTKNGTIIVPGKGYNGASPDSDGNQVDPTGQFVWWYATSRVFRRETETSTFPEADRVDQYVDRATNDIEIEAWQGHAVWWDNCCHIAARVDLCSVVC